MFVLGLLGTAVSAIGTIAGGAAANNAAQAQANMAEFRAKQEENAAAESRASAQRQAAEHRHAGRIAQSQLQARAAADGGSATDPTVLGLDQGIAGRSEYGALMEDYKGENRARGFEDQATLDRMQADALRAQGKAQQTASYFSAGGSLLSGIGSAYSVFKGAPQAKNTYGFG
jgi:hypothetical protein